MIKLVIIIQYGRQMAQITLPMKNYLKFCMVH
uniref:Uncharacterized protein n=1 Tax=Siphoviridae sp. ctxMM9 TaxID=2827973 RepID=A0A8S5T6Q6_9CAUD|nr:MAG TPA: hypothetical protein [Siphoviridae sp. ctxMM9]